MTVYVLGTTKCGLCREVLWHDGEVVVVPPSLVAHRLCVLKHKDHGVFSARWFERRCSDTSKDWCLRRDALGTTFVLRPILCEFRVSETAASDLARHLQRGTTGTVPLSNGSLLLQTDEACVRVTATESGHESQYSFFRDGFSF